ncbi:nuclear transport factor 2 family protein [Streptomyces coeruleorubidus]|uniref:nuclear transport factor 2 family protein n=1 Tax=Streptomyces coeruleorubidus TaxID=116188 RepID=UPI0033ACB4E6
MNTEQQERLLLREELLEIITAVWFDIDHRAGAGASAFFAPDGELRFDASRPFRGAAEIDAVYANRAARGPRVSRHVVTNLHITAVEADRVSAVSMVILFAEDGESPRPTTTPAAVGDVIDVFERHDGRWLIRSRHCQNHFIAPTTVLAVPTK